MVFEHCDQNPTNIVKMTVSNFSELHSFAKEVSNECSMILEELKLLDHPDYVLEITLPKIKFNELKKKFIEFVKTVKRKFLQLVDAGIRLLDELFNNQKKFINNNIDKIKKNALIMSKETFTTHKYRVYGSDKCGLELLDDVIWDGLDEFDTDKLYNTDDVSVETIDQIPNYTYNGNSEKLISALIGNKPYNQDTFVNDAKEYLCYDEKERTIEELGGINNIIDTYYGLYDIKKELKETKKSFNKYIEEIDNIYNIQSDSLGNAYSNIVYSSYYAMYQSIVFIVNNSVTYTDICINMAQKQISEYAMILKRIANHTNIPDEKSTTPISEMLI